ncbi:MAG: hypothetical protein CMM52_07510 [Rhodospirillaceae bacterium]|nr:hypothetical protein [Rhodospirillaceae bacterium]|tara:strand:- start:20922 stop:21542 length:621 start_codon:yes stop_codon:yes gene_type:complete
MKILTTAEAADLLKIKSDTLYSLVEKEGLPGAKVGNQWRFIEEDIVNWLSSKRDRRSENADSVSKSEFEWVYRSLVEATFDAVLVSENNIIADCNDAAPLFYGYPKQELIGKSLHDVMVPEFHEELNETLRLRRTGIIQRIHRRSDGIVIPVEVSIKSFDRDGDIVRLGAIRRLTHLDPALLSPKVREVLAGYDVQSITPGKLSIS